MSRIRIAAPALAAAALVATLAACGSSSSSSAAPSSSAAAPVSSAAAATTASGITIKNFGFSGQLTVKAGEKITVTNQDSVAHTLTDKKTHLFDTGSISGNGGTGTFTAPTKPGSYAFGCTFHPDMAGTLIVTS